MFCMNCGAKLPDSAKFCSKCGSPTAANMAAVTPAAKPVQSSQPMRQSEPAAYGQNGPMKLYFNMKGASLLNYNMVFTDEQGTERYHAKTVTESLTQYTFRAWYPNNQELLTVRTKTKKFATMYFEASAANGRLITSIEEVVQNVAYCYQLPEAGLFAEGDFLAFHFHVTRNGQEVAVVNRAPKFMADSYEISILDPSCEQAIISLMLAIQLRTIQHRRNRRR